MPVKWPVALLPLPLLGPCTWAGSFRLAWGLLYTVSLFMCAGDISWADSHSVWTANMATTVVLKKLFVTFSSCFKPFIMPENRIDKELSASCPVLFCHILETGSSEIPNNFVYLPKAV